MVDRINESRSQHAGNSGGNRRKSRRAVLACSFCRQRKARCSGDWPTCLACARRKQACVYLGTPPTIRSFTPDGEAAAGPSSTEESISTIKSLPSNDLRRKVITYFRENYATTLLSFIPPQQLIEDDVGKELPLPLFLCILALVSRSIPEFASGQISLSKISEYYAESARQELDRILEQPSLVTVQCCLVLCIYDIGEGSEHRGWLRLGHAARLTQLLQLHRQDLNQNQNDWGNLPPSSSLVLAEIRRRTFWCCFCLERLLANGRDRIAVFLPEDITTQLPQSDEDFIYGRHKNSCTLNCSNADTDHNHNQENLFAHTVRIIDILSKVMTWHGRGGRHLDARVPWLPEMPFTVLDDLLQRWKASIPSYLDYSVPNSSAIIAAGQGRLWALMFMVYFQARAYLHREYLPFTPKKEYDPPQGPCDGPALFSSDIPPQNFWHRSAVAMIESANSISDLYVLMKGRNLCPSAYPIPGLGLLTAASIHVMYSIFEWDSMQDTATAASSRGYLRQDMECFNDIGQRWSLAIHWLAEPLTLHQIRQVSLYYKLNCLTKRSWSNPESNLTRMNVKEIKDGIMNYVRQISQQDRETREINLKEEFNFHGWLSVLENSIGGDVVQSQDTEAGSLDNPEDTQFVEQLPPDLENRLTGTYRSSFPWFSNMDGLAATPSQAEWIFNDDTSWAFEGY